MSEVLGGRYNGFIPFWPNYVNVSGVYAIDWIEPSEFINFKQDNISWFFKVMGSSHESWSSISEKLTLDDNPIVRIVKLKHNENN
ncbi:MAG: hypothetical protein M0R50_11860 [Candidatus Cloacimonetes bacterium]|jgi:hypothetical protein|nr:hypothetical protein [Candidatus Cloacimonadota bacterium]